MEEKEFYDIDTKKIENINYPNLQVIYAKI